MLWLALWMSAASATDVQSLDAWLTRQAERGVLIGAVRVVDGDELLLARSYGGAPDNPLCRIGSLSKSFTAAATLALVDEGLLDLDTTVSEALPELAGRVDPGPTLHHLMHHRGGLSEAAANPWMRPPTWEEQVALAYADLRQEHPPGEREAYSNSGFTLLAASVSRAANSPFEAVLRTRLWAPLGLTDTTLTPHPDEPTHALRGHLFTPVGLVDAGHALPRLLPHDYRWPHAGDGGLTASPADLVRWATALRDGQVLSDRARDLLITPWPGSETAAGWVREGSRVWHNGALNPLGIYAYLRWSVDDTVVVAFCATPTVGDVEPEWRAPVEEALAGGTPADIEATSTPFGLLAAASALWLHWLFGALGVALAASAPRVRGIGLGTATFGAGLATLGFGLSHAGVGLVALAVAAVAARRRRPPADAPAAGCAGHAVGLVGVLTLGIALVLLGILAGLSWLVDNVWTLA